MAETDRQNLRTGVVLLAAFVLMLIGSALYIITFH